MTRKRILVCGATGFIGRNIAESFAARADYEVIGVYNKRPAFQHPGVSWRQADLTRAEDIERVVEGIDVIVQAAATTSGSKDIVARPYIHVTDNAVMNSLLLRAAFDRKIGQFLFFSCTVMLQSADKPQTEDDFDANAELHPRYFGVGWTKLYVEKMCAFYARISPIRFTVIRHSNIYGPHDKFDLERSHVFGATVTKVLTAKDGKVIVWGTGEEARDLLYVDDLVDFCARAIDRQQDKFLLLNAGAGSAVPVKDLVQKIIAASGQALAIEHDLSQPSIKTSLCLDCSAAKAALGWQPRTSLEEGIRHTIAWWRANVAL
jgi:nucleoside-diphosphate-sugar epimerase